MKKNKRLLAAMLCVAMVLTALAVLTILPAAASPATRFDGTAPYFPPAQGELVSVSWPGASVDSVTAAGTTIKAANPAEGGGRIGTAHYYNAKDIAIDFTNIQYAGVAPETAGFTVCFVKAQEGDACLGAGAGWFDKPSLLVTFRKNGQIKLGYGSTGWGSEAELKTLDGFDLGGDKISFTLKEEGESFRLTANGKEETFELIETQKNDGLDMGKVSISLMPVGGCSQFTIANLTGGAVGSTCGFEFPTKSVEVFMPTPADQLKNPPADGEIVNTGYNGITPSIAASAEGTSVSASGMSESSFWIGSKSTYNLNDTSMVIDNVKFADDAGDNAELFVYYSSEQFQIYPKSALFFGFTKGGTVNLYRGRNIGVAPSVYRSFTGFDFSGGRIEYSIKLEGEIYTMQVNDKSFTFPKADLDWLSDPLLGDGITPLDPEHAYLVLLCGNTSSMDFRIANITGGAEGATGGFETESEDSSSDTESVEFTPTPADQLKNPPADGEIYNKWASGGVEVSGSTITFTGADQRGTRVGTRSTYDLEKMHLVINNIQRKTEGMGISVLFSMSDNGWTDYSGLRLSIYPDGTVGVAKYYTPKKIDDTHQNAVLRSKVAISADMSEVVEISLDETDDAYVLVINGQKIPIAKTEVEGVFSDDGAEGLNYHAAYLVFGISPMSDEVGNIGDIAYTVADITGRSGSESEGTTGGTSGGTTGGTTGSTTGGTSGSTTGGDVQTGDDFHLFAALAAIILAAAAAAAVVWSKKRAARA